MSYNTLIKEYAQITSLVDTILESNPEMVFSETEEAILDKFYELETALTYLVEEKVGQSYLRFKVSPEGEVSFSINGSMDRIEDTPDKLSLTKRLLYHFHIIKQERDELFCVAYDEDGYRDYREKMYRKLGFKKVNSVLMEWRAN